MARSENVFKARRSIPSAFHLCKLCAKATREMHFDSGRVEDTINLALVIIGNRRCIDEALTSMLYQLGESPYAFDE